MNGGYKLATRESVENILQQCAETIQYAQEQYDESRRQEHDNLNEYTVAMQQLENVYNELNKLMLSANDQQREQLYRMRLQIQQLQNSMILNDLE